MLTVSLKSPKTAFGRYAQFLRIPVNVTGDSGNVTGNSGEGDRGSVLRGLILCRLAFSAVSPCLVLASLLNK